MLATRLRYTLFSLYFNYMYNEFLAIRIKVRIA